MGEKPEESPFAVPSPGAEGPPGKDGKDGRNGKDGKDGKQGPAGPQGPPGISVITLEYLDAYGNVVESETFTDGKIRIRPIKVENYDNKNNLIDVQEYPYPGPLRLRYNRR